MLARCFILCVKFVFRFVLFCFVLQVKKMCSSSSAVLFALTLALYVVEVASAETLCGGELVDALQFVCEDRGFYFSRFPLRPFLSFFFSFFFPSTAASLRASRPPACSFAHICLDSWSCRSVCGCVECVFAVFLSHAFTRALTHSLPHAHTHSHTQSCPAACLRNRSPLLCWVCQFCPELLPLIAYERLVSREGTHDSSRHNGPLVYQ